MRSGNLSVVSAIAKSGPSESGAGKTAPAKAGVGSMSGRQRFLQALECRPLDRPPLWLMRQAGRALPEYRKLKETYSFLELVQTPQLAAEVTLQPIRRFHFDAAVFFSDILIVSEAMGQSYRFRDGGGIQMDFTLETAADIARLEPGAVRERLQYVAEALPLVRSELGERTALLGFAGSPWTLANFMLEGGSSREFTKARALFYSEPALFRQLMKKLTEAVTECLRIQIEAGADAVQIFDSLGGELPATAYEEASASWIREIITGLGGRAPVIVFGKGVHGNWDALLRTGAQGFSVDWTLSLSDVRRQLPAQVAVQGNLDPLLLTTSAEVVAREARALLESMRGRGGHIFNLGHGVPPTAKLECLESLVSTVQGFQ